VPLRGDSRRTEHTYLEAKQGATGTVDSETAAMFFVRELRYRRLRYAAHARMADHSLTHRVDAALRWATNGFLDLVAGYGERPQRTLGLGDVHPAGDVGRFIAASEGLTGAFLTAVFVFSLGRRVTR